MTAALPMGGQKITGMADPTVATDASTKNYVDTTTGTFFSTGDAKLTFKIVPDSGWLMLDDGTFGSASSGSSNSNNIANLALFTLFFNAPFTDANIPILTSGGGATTRAAQVSASAAWAANCRMSLPKSLGRALGIAGSGASLTTRTLGQSIGAETNTLVMSNLPASPAPVTVTATPTSGGLPSLTVNNASAPGTVQSGVATAIYSTATFAALNIAIGANTANLGSGAAFGIMPPMSYLNCMVKI